jgi:hypothetical protein
MVSNNNTVKLVLTAMGMQNTFSYRQTVNTVAGEAYLKVMKMPRNRYKIAISVPSKLVLSPASDNAVDMIDFELGGESRKLIQSSQKTANIIALFQVLAVELESSQISINRAIINFNKSGYKNGMLTFLSTTTKLSKNAATAASELAEKAWVII